MWEGPYRIRAAGRISCVGSTADHHIASSSVDTRVAGRWACPHDDRSSSRGAWVVSSYGSRAMFFISDDWPDRWRLGGSSGKALEGVLGVHAAAFSGCWWLGLCLLGGFDGEAMKLDDSAGVIAGAGISASRDERDACVNLHRPCEYEVLPFFQ